MTLVGSFWGKPQEDFSNRQVAFVNKTKNPLIFDFVMTSSAILDLWNKFCITVKPIYLWTCDGNIKRFDQDL